MSIRTSRNRRALTSRRARPRKAIPSWSSKTSLISPRKSAPTPNDGHPVRLAATAADGLAAARIGWASVFVVDRMLHGDDGLSIVETLRGEGVATPVLVISALSSVDERIHGLKAGGDDYLVKPFDVRELTARVEALLRRRGDRRATRLRAGDIEMDLVERTVRCAGRPVDLLPREFKLLEYFTRRPGQIVTRSMLLEDVWNFKFMAQTNVVDVQIGNLRRKLDPTGCAEVHRQRSRGRFQAEC